MSSAGSDAWDEQSPNIWPIESEEERQQVLRAIDIANNKVKVALGICQGKVEFDKRQDTRKRDAEREVKRATMHRLKGR